MLLVHTGKAVEFAREDLPTEIVRPENAGNRWRGVSHRDYAEAIMGDLNDRGVEVTSDRWATLQKGQVLIGSLDVVPPNIDGIPGQKFSTAVTHSNNMTRSMWMTVGTTVMICDNGVVTGEYVLRRKHTIRMDLGLEIHNALDRAMVKFGDTSRVVNQLRDTKMSKLAVDHSFMEVGRRGSLAWSQVGKAVKEYENPEHPEFLEFKGRAWGVYQAVNHVVKERSPLSQMESLRDLTKLLVAA